MVGLCEFHPKGLKPLKGGNMWWNELQIRSVRKWSADLKLIETWEWVAPLKIFENPNYHGAFDGEVVSGEINETDRNRTQD